MCYLVTVRNVWPVDGGLSPNVSGRVYVGILSMAARFTDKMLLSFSVSLLAVSAHVARLGRVARVYRFNRHAVQLGLVFDLRAKIKERPVGVSPALSVPNRYPFADAIEFFDGDTASGVVGLADDCLTDTMILVLLIPGLFAFYLAKFAFGRLRALVLKSSASVQLLLSRLLNCLARMRLAVAVGSDIHDAHVHADEIFHISRRWLFDSAGDVKIKTPIDIAQVRLSALAKEKFFLSIPGYIVNLDSSIDCPDRHDRLIKVKAEDTRIVGNCPRQRKLALGLFVDFVSIGNFANATNDYLRRQSGEHRPAFVVCQLLKRKLVKRFGIPPDIGQPVASSVGELKGSFERINLLIRCTKSELRCQLHTVHYIQLVENIKRFCKEVWSNIRGCAERPEGAVLLPLRSKDTEPHEVFIVKKHFQNHWIDTLMVLIIVLGVGFIAIQTANKSYDDAFITYRYAKNLALGQGFNYNVGQIYLGTTTPLLSLLLAALAKLTTVDLIPIFGQWLTAISLAGLCFLTYLQLRDKHRIASIVSALVTLCSPALVSLWGGESLQLLCLLAGGFYFYSRGYRGLAYVLLALAYLTRAEGGLAIVLVGVHEWLSQRHLPVRGILVTTLFVGAWSVFSFITFGSPLPGTLGAKIAQMHSGMWSPFLLTSLDWVRSFALKSPNFPTDSNVTYSLLYILVLAGGVFLLLHRTFDNWIFPVWILLYAIGYHLINVPFYPWYALPLFYAIALMAGKGVQLIYDWLMRWTTRWARLLSLGIGAVSVMAILFVMGSDTYHVVTQPVSAIQHIYIKTGLWMHEHVPADATVGYFEIGFIGFYSERNLIDAAGLINPNVAAHIAKGDFKWVYLHYQPDYLLINATRWYPRLGSIRDEAWFSKAYKPVMVISEPGYFDSPITIYQKVDASQIPHEAN